MWWTKPSARFHDALMVMKDLIEKPAVVAGAVEAEVARRIREWSVTQQGRVQLAVEVSPTHSRTYPGPSPRRPPFTPSTPSRRIRSRHATGGKWFGDRLEERAGEGHAHRRGRRAGLGEGGGPQGGDGDGLHHPEDYGVFNKEVRAYRRKSEMTPEQRNRLRPPTAREQEEFMDRYEKFPFNKPKDVRYPLDRT